MSSDRIKTAIERMNRGLGVMEARAKTGTFDRAEQRRQRQEARDKELRDQARKATGECERVTEQLQALELRHAELVGANDSLVAQFEALAGQSGNDVTPTTNGVDQERFDHLKETHKALKRKYQTLCEAATGTIGQLDEMIGPDSAAKTPGGMSDG